MTHPKYYVSCDFCPTVTYNVCAGVYRWFYVRLSVQSLSRWWKSSERGIGRNMDNFDGASLWRGFHIGRWFDFRHYYMIATHVGIGPVTFSLCQDRYGLGSMGRKFPAIKWDSAPVAR